jgi:hypothetical protein
MEIDEPRLNAILEEERKEDQKYFGAWWKSLLPK